MEREKRDLYNINSELTRKTYFKGDPIPEGYYPMVVMIAIQNSKGEFLMQKRVPRKGVTGVLLEDIQNLVKLQIRV